MMIKIISTLIILAICVILIKQWYSYYQLCQIESYYHNAHLQIRGLIKSMDSVIVK